MKYKLALLFGMLSGLTVSMMAWAEAPPLVFCVAIDKTDVLLGQGIVADIVIRNVSSNSVKVLRPSTSSISASLGAKNAEQIPATVGVDANILPSDIVTLLPGEAVSNQLDVASITGAPIAAGKYRLILSYRSFGPGSLEIDLMGKPLEIEYIQPTGDELHAWVLFKDRNDKASGLPKKQVLNEIISKYPHTTYAGQAKKLLKELHLKE